MGNAVKWFRQLLPLMAGVMVMLATTGCGSGHSTTTGTPVKPAEAWDPCTGISEQALRHAGLDPAAKGDNAEGPPGWKFCGWNPIGYRTIGPTAYTVSVMSTTKESIEGIRQDPINNHFADVTVSGRRGLEYHTGGSDPNEECDVAFGTSHGGVVSVFIDRIPINPYPEPVCDSTEHTAAQLLPALPE